VMPGGAAVMPSGYGQAGMMYTPRVPGQAGLQRPLTPGAQARRLTAQRPGVAQAAPPPRAAQPYAGAPGIGYAQRQSQAPQAPQPQAYQPQPAAAPVAQAPATISPQLVENIQQHIEKRDTLKTSVIQSFKKVAGANRTVDINGLVRLRRELSIKLGIPEQIFGTIEDEYIRFDFDGSGFLEANEVYKLVKWHLYEFLQTSGVQGKDTIPQKSLQQAGYTTTREIGAGNQAVVKVACDKYGNQRCIKCYKKSAMFNAGSLSDMQEEFATMQLLACKNIARTFEIFQDVNFVYMVNEVYWGGDLTQLQDNAESNKVAITEDWWKGIFRQCFEALQFMHQQAMMHCDIKEPNLMLRTENYREPQVVLIDFGVSKAMTAKDTGSVSGTPGYMPPETMNTGKWYPGGDIFSMGVVIMQLLTKRVPDEDKARQGIMIGIFLEGCRDIEGVKTAVNSRNPPFHLMPNQWPGVRQMAMRCLEKNLRLRPKAPTVLKDPWFGGSDPKKEATPVEKAMMPQHPMATVGITEEMMQSTPMTCAISADAMAEDTGRRTISADTYAVPIQASPYVVAQPQQYARGAPAGFVV